MRDEDFETLSAMLATAPGVVGAKILELLHREKVIPTTGYANLTDATVDALAAALKGARVLDAGSGTGYMAHRLSEVGVDVCACDVVDVNESREVEPSAHRWKLDVRGNAVDLLPGEFDAVILSWPDIHSPFAFEVASKLKSGQSLWYLGESRGGCTASDDFFNLMMDEQLWLLETWLGRSLNEVYRPYTGMKDRWWVFRRI
ncbi:hypothetical protein F6X40_09585 [Paraburkholderia sp. UCT31]|uniref:class I SAM-dependent methyltransferase n=1 Tax=Paraburkholderia sp. UCT31 TaxID=2615209 RepID=UPI0016551896|nr:hypothetical protein [Paraburkholderia sp. UCT31]MBC8737059.1 hypothetical protein [Paraburkholderia sp. UCT31]